MSLRSWFDKTPDIDPYDWELELELEEAVREAEWEAQQERIIFVPEDFLVKCESCGDVDHSENMWALGYNYMYLCDQCWEEAEEDEY